MGNLGTSQKIMSEIGERKRDGREPAGGHTLGFAE